MSHCAEPNGNPRIFTIWHMLRASCAGIVSCKLILGPDSALDLNRTNVFHCCAVPPQKPTSKFLLCFCLFVLKLIIFIAKTERISIKGEQESGWMEQSVCDAPALHHSPIISHLECVNQDSVYAQLCSSDRFIQRELVFRGLQRQRKCKLFETIYHRDQCCFKGCGS